LKLAKKTVLTNEGTLASAIAAPRPPKVLLRAHCRTAHSVPFADNRSIGPIDLQLWVSARAICVRNTGTAAVDEAIEWVKTAPSVPPFAAVRRGPTTADVNAVLASQAAPHRICHRLIGNGIRQMSREACRFAGLHRGVSVPQHTCICISYGLL
jgi:hypothetical protein